MQTGLDPDRWFCCVHYRETNYAYKQMSNFRDVDPDSYEALKDFIIDELGGQVVRMGHPEMAKWTNRPGFVDLSRYPESWRLQFYAMSRARFFIGSGSGATGMSTGLNIPSAHTDIGDYYTGRPGDLVLTHEIIHPNGDRLMQESLLKAGLFSNVEVETLIEEGQAFGVRKNSTAELFAAARQIYDRTADIDAWRTAPRAIKTGRNRLSWPPAEDRGVDFVDLSSI